MRIAVVVEFELDVTNEDGPQLTKVLQAVAQAGDPIVISAYGYGYDAKVLNVRRLVDHAY